MSKKTIRLLLIPIILILGGFASISFDGVPGVVIPLLAIIISVILFVTSSADNFSNKETQAIDSSHLKLVNKILTIVPLELIVSAVMMLCGVFFGDFFGVSAYLFFFFACIPLLAHTLRKKFPLPDGEVKSYKKFFFTLIIWGSISGLLWAGFLQLLFFLMSNYNFSESSPIFIFITLVLLAICAFPILYYLNRILPKQINSNTLNLSFFPTGIVTYFCFFLTYYSINFFWGLDNEDFWYITLYLILFILYMFAPIFYVRNFLLQATNPLHKFESFKVFCKNFILTSIITLTVCTILYIYYDIDPLDFPSCC